MSNWLYYALCSVLLSIPPINMYEPYISRRRRIKRICGIGLLVPASYYLYTKYRVSVGDDKINEE